MLRQLKIYTRPFEMSAIGVLYFKVDQLRIVLFIVVSTVTIYGDCKAIFQTVQ